MCALGHLYQLRVTGIILVLSWMQSPMLNRFSNVVGHHSSLIRVEVPRAYTKLSPLHHTIPIFTHHTCTHHTSLPTSTWCVT